MESNDRLRAELEAAITKVSRQIEIESGSRNLAAVGPSSRPALVEALQAELSDLKSALSGLGGSGPPAYDGGGRAGQSDEGTSPETTETHGGGVMIALRRSSAGEMPQFDPALLGRLLVFLGAVGAAISVVLAAVHFILGAPLYEGRASPRVMSDPETLEALAAILGGSAIAAGLGAIILRDASRREQTR